MPYLGLLTEIESKVKFKEILTKDFQVDPIHRSDMGKTARRLGGICMSLRGGRPVRDDKAHVSVTSSGELNFSLKRGGQAQAVRDAINRILLPVEATTYMEDTPFGVAEHREGVPLWKTLFVSQEDQIDLIFSDFLDVIPWIKDFPSGRHGLDAYTGKQIMYCAWKEMEALPLLRATTVAELGNKARMVTLSAYWLNVLQAPLAHLLKEILKSHPCCYSSFTRGDQAWEAARSLGNIPPGVISSFKVLSSDLKDATNAQMHDLTRHMLREFLVGTNLISDWSYVDIVLGTIGPRMISLDDDIFVTSRGIMMGEAIAKPSLTLLNLAVEELAYIQFTGGRKLLDSPVSAKSAPWRCYHVGGDDHLAIGPDLYLDLITRNHERSGSIISPDKHGLSRVMVKYCERILFLENLQYNQTRRNHEKSLIIDGVKVRLLAKGQSTLMSKDNKNVAVGKAQQLVKTLEWLPSESFSIDRINMIRNLFIKRMHGLLPSLNRDPEAYHSVHLPKILGGYGLGLPDELIYHASRAKPGIKYAITLLMTGIDSTKTRRLLSRLNQNLSDRSVKNLDWYRSELTSQLRQYPDLVGGVDGSEIRRKFPADTYQLSKDLAKSAGWLDVESFAKQVTRGNMFQELLEHGADKEKIFKSRPWIQEYNRISSKLEEEAGYLPEPDWEEISAKDLQAVLRGLNEDMFIDISQNTSFDKGETEDDFDFFDGELGSTYFAHRPSLRLGTKFIGVSNTLNSFTRRVRPKHY
jgi:hypothetical protein